MRVGFPVHLSGADDKWYNFEIFIKKGKSY